MIQNEKSSCFKLISFVPNSCCKFAVNITDQTPQESRTKNKIKSKSRTDSIEKTNIQAKNVIIQVEITKHFELSSFACFLIYQDPSSKPIILKPAHTIANEAAKVGYNILTLKKKRVQFSIELLFVSNNLLSLIVELADNREKIHSHSFDIEEFGQI